MKKVIKLVSVFIISLFIFPVSVSAEELNCNKYLSSGSRGNDVEVLQSMLNKVVECNLKVDGIFGSLTNKCVRTFQSKYSLDVDGIVGPNTCNKLNSLINTTTDTNKVSTINKTNSNILYVIVNNANIRKKPTTNSKILTTKSMGKKLRVVKQVGDWYKVKLSNRYGYVRSDLVSDDVIVVDISEQVLYYNKNGENVLTTSVVTGEKNSHDTPVGKYVLKLSNLQRARTLRGVNDDGSRYAAYVEYWMPFIMERGIGFHDATWRASSEFNENTYIGDGSHGCVNMQYDAAKTLYNSIDQDTAVIIKK